MSKTTSAPKTTKTRPKSPAKPRTAATKRPVAKRAAAKPVAPQSALTVPKPVMASKLSLTTPDLTRSPVKPVRWLHTPLITKLALCSVFILVVAIVTMLGTAQYQTWWPTAAAAIGLAVGWFFTHE